MVTLSDDRWLFKVQVDAILLLVAGLVDIVGEAETAVDRLRFSELVSLDRLK